MVTTGIIFASVMVGIQYNRITTILNVINNTNTEEIVNRVTTI